jgi:tRNA G10  N-methylase Trm11
LKGRAVIGLPDKKLIEEGERYLSLVKDFELRVHKSLTRYFAVYE